MSKKCMICGSDAAFHIKDSSEYYCEDCAQENFSDLQLLEPLHSQAQKIKEMIEQRAKDDQPTITERTEK